MFGLDEVELGAAFIYFHHPCSIVLGSSLTAGDLSLVMALQLATVNKFVTNQSSVLYHVTL